MKETNRPPELIMCAIRLKSLDIMLTTIAANLSDLSDSVTRISESLKEETDMLHKEINLQSRLIKD